MLNYQRVWGWVKTYKIIRNYHVLMGESPSINQLYPTILVYLGTQGFDL